MGINEIKSGRPKKGVNPFNDIFRNLIGDSATQQEVADKIGVSRQNVGRWLSGDTTPDIETLCKIANAYNVSTDYLLGRTEVKTTDELIQATVDYMGITEKSAENIRTITRSGGNVDILLERDDFKEIVELLNKIKIITVGQRYYNEQIVPCIQKNDLLDGLFNRGEFQPHSKLVSYTNYAISQLIERQFDDDMAIDISVIGSSGVCDNLYKEKLMLTEYHLTEHLIRAMINDIINDTTTDNEKFEEYYEQIGDNLDYLLLNLQSTLEDAPKHYTGDKLEERKKDIQADIDLLDKFIKFYNEHYRKDDEDNG